MNSVRGKSRYETGRVVPVALQPQPVTVEWIREGIVTMSGDHTMDDLRRILTLVELGRVNFKKSITHVLPFEDLNNALKMLRRQAEGVDCSFKLDGFL